mmetsp:Transcript_22423/g.70328  ORF Transcript_22423/g.70328 Transcript_22423/m.70328 type:complete len:147 (-) Transcript_22423:19-459(-)
MLPETGTAPPPPKLPLACRWRTPRWPGHISGISRYTWAVSRVQVENVLQAGAPIDPQSGEIVPARLQEWLAGLSTYIAFCDGVVQKGATRLALMPPAMAGPISLYLSAVGRHRLLGAELQSRLKAFQVTLYARADRAGSEGISQSL